MGVVYRVEHLHLGKTAAMKVLAPDTAEKPEMLRRFRLEAQSVSKLNHPNIVQTFDFGQFDGALYLVMEFIKGDDLAALLKREGPWSSRARRDSSSRSVRDWRKRTRRGSCTAISSRKT